MDYKKQYDLLINRARDRTIVGYKESHHIIPKCLGGVDEKENLVDLTAREHFIAHLLLCKIHKGHHGLVKAAMMMLCSSSNQQRITNRCYGWLKEKHAVAMSAMQTGQNNSQHGTMWITNDQENRKIKKDDMIPDGWRKGRKIKKTTKADQRVCKMCGEKHEKGKVPYQCMNFHQKVNTYAKYFGLDLSIKGTKEIFSEIKRVEKMLEKNYHIDGMSVQNMMEFYGVTTNESMRQILIRAGIKRRDISESLINFNQK